MRTDLFEYHLPRELIAAVPAQRRDQSRLLVVDRHAGRVGHSMFSRIGEHLRAGDLLVANDSRVIRARIHGKRLATGGKVEFLLLERTGGGDRDTWRVMCRPARKLKPGEVVYFANKRFEAQVLHYVGEGEREVEFSCPDVMAWLDEIGEVPLPPYIVQRRRELREEARAKGLRSAPIADEEDAERYQTVYARDPGSVAAPTAGLHFTNELIARLKESGVGFETITLHVGPGTFKPVEVEDVEGHVMHSEHFVIRADAADAVNAAQAEGRRVIAIGTTAVRALESATTEDGPVSAGQYDTSLMIVPGYRFRVVDAMVTNFHLPRSTLLMLVSAFAGRELMLGAYEEAVRQEYRFYSFGDAMLIS
jgi:S-adenosylmethionine:tRNA ribosyltransferase-isomerase